MAGATRPAPRRRRFVGDRNGHGIPASADPLHLDIQVSRIETRGRCNGGIANGGVRLLDRGLARAGARRVRDEQPIAREDPDLDEREQHQQQEGKEKRELDDRGSAFVPTTHFPRPGR